MSELEPRTVAALYVDPRGPYPQLAGVECWDLLRDAKSYDGPHPIVAHPPCGPWGRLKFLSRHQDKSCAPRAVEQVRAFGGVLEHPEHSSLWRALRMPRPDELPDEHGGRAWLVHQVAWGHACVKPTWLYTVGIAPELVLAGMRTGGAPTHRVTRGPRGTQLRTASVRMRIHTPGAFAAWLVSLARSARL